jgi:MFS family permease
VSLLIRAAARTLPAAIRDRYREQWLADARDATEAGLSPSSITLAALAFAVTYDRPLPARRVPTAEQRAQRSRLAVGLALSAALLALSVYPALSLVGRTGVAVWDFFAFFATSMLAVYGVLAPLTALVLVRGARRRWAVVLLAAATTWPLAFMLGVGHSDNIYLNGIWPFAVALALIVGACALLWRPSGTSRWAPLIGAFAVWAVTAAGLVYASVFAWPNRTPLVYGEPTQAYYAEWLRLKNDFEALVNQTFLGWAIAGLVLGVIVLLMGRRMGERAAAALGLGAVAISLLGATGVFGLLELGMGGTIPDPLLDPLRLVAQVLLVSVTLVAVGGVRYLPRVRHRHDVESGVELL